MQIPNVEKMDLEALVSDTRLLKLDTKFAIEYFKDKSFHEINKNRIYSCDFGYVVLTQQNDYILTNRRGVLGLTQ